MNLYTPQEAAQEVSKIKPITSAMIRHYLRKNQITGKWTGLGWVITKVELNRFIRKYTAI